MTLYVEHLNPEQREFLENIVRSGEDPELAQRAEIVLLSACWQRVPEISEMVGMHPINVRKWISRFNQLGLAGLFPRRSPGRPRLFSEEQRQAIVALAIRPPCDAGLGYPAWSLARLRRQLIAQRVIPEISLETIRQELRQSGLVFMERHWVLAAVV